MAVQATTVDIWTLVTGLGGGLALFLFGMRQMSDSLITVAGSSMKNLLAKLTVNRFTATFAGALVTAVIQSSSVTTVLVVGFVSAGLMTVSQSIGVIIGANVGTTLTAQVIAFDVYRYGLLMIASGFFVDLIAKSEKKKHWGMALMGLGLIFFGMELMSNATGPLRAWQPFISVMQNLRNPYLAIVVGIVFTAIVQSSSATTGIVIVLASQGLLSLESGIGLIFGGNVGTCITAIIAAFGRSREAVQAAWIHVLFNVGGVLLWMPFIDQFAEFVKICSPTTNHLQEQARLMAETPRQIANAHTLFNVGNTLLFIWFTVPLAKFVEWIVPATQERVSAGSKYLDEMFLDQPALALDQVRRELARLAAMDREMLSQAFGVVTVGTQQDVMRLKRADDDVDALYGDIVTYLAKLSQKHMVDPESNRLNTYISIANYLENVGDVIENDILIDAIKRDRRRVAMSKETIDVLNVVHQKVCWAFDRVVDALRDDDPLAARDAAASKRVVNELAEKATAHLTTRLIAYEPNRLAAFRIETDTIGNLQRINTLTRRIARSLVTVKGGESSENAKVARDVQSRMHDAAIVESDA